MIFKYFLKKINELVQDEIENTSKIYKMDIKHAKYATANLF